jgi:predicted nucleotide-binding protein
MRPRLFVGSSREALDIANAIHENLVNDAEVTVWNQGISELSQTTLESLLEKLDDMDFGVFVFAPDDVVQIRGEQGQATRDNVVFELGLFVGRRGKERSFFILPSEHDPVVSKWCQSRPRGRILLNCSACCAQAVFCMLHCGPSYRSERTKV